MTIKLKILKTWINKDFTIIFQTSIVAPKEQNLPKKIHLLIDLRQQTFGLRLGADKPGQATANHAFIQILRKHIPQFTIKEILRDSSSDDLYIPLLSGPQGEGFWYIKLANSKPPLASLIDPTQTVQVSYGQKGTFTKKHQLETVPEWSEFENIFPALASLVASKDAPEEEEAKDDEERDGSHPIPEDQRELAARLKRKLRTTRKNLEKLRNDLPARADVECIRQNAIHLQRYAYLVVPDAFELRLDASQTATETDLQIEINPDLSVGRNIEAAYERSRKAERKLKMGSEQVQQFELYEKELLEDIESLRTEAQPESYWQKLINKYKLPQITLSSSGNGSGSQSTPTAKAYRTYLSSTGHLILVGKGARENDELTKAARANDYWFHAVGVTGSHVIVPCTPDLRSALPSQVLKEAAMLALHSSRLKDDLAGECYVTRRASLKKQKGMAAGLWKIDHSETVFIRYQEDELQRVLQNIKA